MDCERLRAEPVMSGTKWSRRMPSAIRFPSPYKGDYSTRSSMTLSVANGEAEWWGRKSSHGIIRCSGCIDERCDELRKGEGEKIPTRLPRAPSPPRPLSPSHPQYHIPCASVRFRGERSFAYFSLFPLCPLWQISFSLIFSSFFFASSASSR